MHIKMVFSPLVTTTLLLLLISPTKTAEVSTGNPKPSTFKAAVLEHKAFLLDDPTKLLSRDKALQFMEKNLKVYENQAKKAKEEGAQIIIFPENGITGYDFTRDSIAPFLESIPDPKNTSWSPCSNPEKFVRNDIQKALSCIAKDNSMYVVANMPDKVLCHRETDPKCPKVGHYQYNTNVAYSPDGTFLAKYHKVHLWFEDYFDPGESKVSYFDTPFAGRIGLIICYDLFFGDPLVTLLTKHNVKTIAYPTDFVDFLPFVTAIGFHSSVARGLGINVLAANMHDVQYRGYGSGIYTPNGPSVYYYDDRKSSPGKLLVSSINSLDQRIMPNHEQRENSLLVTNESKGDQFPVDLLGDEFTFKLLEGSSGNINVCHNNACCSLNYSLSGDSDKNELFAVGVFDGLHNAFGRFYWQICTLMKCADDYNKSTCGYPTKISATKFESVSLKSHFQTNYIYPQVILVSTKGDEQLRLPDEKTWSFNDSTVAWESGVLEEPVISVTMIGRIFHRDHEKADVVSGQRNDLTPTPTPTPTPASTTSDPGNAGVKTMERHAVFIITSLVVIAVAVIHVHYLRF